MPTESITELTSNLILQALCLSKYNHMFKPMGKSAWRTKMEPFCRIILII